MKLRYATCFLLAAAVLAGFQQSGEAEKELEAAIHKEVVQGDLKAAIEQYKKLAQGANKPVAARALVRLGECYEKQGNADARKTYEQVLSKFGDQKEPVMQARARLTAMGGGGTAAPETGVKSVRVWANLPGGFADELGLSPDGRYAAYIDWDTGGSLGVRDLPSGTDRNLTHADPAKKDNIAEDPVFMPDSRRIVYFWSTGDVYELRIVGVDGSGERTILRNLENQPYVEAISQDGKLAAAQFGGGRGKPDPLALISLDAGDLRVVKNFAGVDPWGLRIGNFSRDGRWLVCSLQTHQGSLEYEAYAIATDGTVASKLIPAPGVSGTPFYTPDGSRVVFEADRAGRTDLWSVPVADGKALDAPELLKAGVGEHFTGLGFSQDGSFYFQQWVPRSGVYVAEVDPATWKLRAVPKQVSDGFRDLTVASPAWSPDGKSLAYVSNPPSGTGRGEVTFVIRNADSGQRKEVSAHYDNVGTAVNFRWFADGKSLILNGPPSPRLLDIGAGRDRVLFDKRVGGAVSSPDGRSLFYTTVDAGMDSSVSCKPLAPSPPRPGNRRGAGIVPQGLLDWRPVAISGWPLPCVYRWISHKALAAVDIWR